jgi:aryl-alcohol dehydrogenase-like predicted oxidoreductase
VKAVLTGVRSASELESNIRDFDAEVPAELWEALEAKGLIEPLDIS